MSPRALLRRAVGVPAVLVTAALALALVGTTAQAATTPAANPVTPGDFAGYGFDQCHAPSQDAMHRWMLSSPYLAAGIYISGASRACRDQPNLTPSWVSTQLAEGWKLLPITLGPQASCSTRFPRYGNDPVIRGSSTNNYAAARTQGRAEADTAVAAAKKLGIVPGSILWYDLEAWDIKHSTDCNRSALWFMNAWTYRLHQLGFSSGYYSSAASGIYVMDRERSTHGVGITNLPDYLWIAEWHSSPTVRSAYIPDDGWMPHRRVHQYQGGHDETHGGVTINIDNDWLDVGRGAVNPPTVSHCDGTRVGFLTYFTLGSGTNHPSEVQGLKCLLKEQGWYTSPYMGPAYNAGLASAVRKWRVAKGLSSQSYVDAAAWQVVLADGGAKPVLKVGSSSDAVRRVQRALNAAGVGPLKMTGLFDASTAKAVQTYRTRVGLPANGIVTSATWAALLAGKR